MASSQDGHPGARGAARGSYLVIFGLTVRHPGATATLRSCGALCGALAGCGHHVIFFERAVPDYASHRDLCNLDGGRLILYGDWQEARPAAARHLADADAAMVTSFCPDALAATALLLESRARPRVFYDLDAPVTLARVGAGAAVGYVGPGGLRGFDLVLSFGRGASLEQMERRRRRNPCRARAVWMRDRTVSKTAVHLQRARAPVTAGGYAASGARPTR
jgi:hypothetical protein